MTLVRDGTPTPFPQSHNQQLVRRLTTLWDSVRGRFGDWGEALAEEARAWSLPLTVRLRFIVIMYARDIDTRGDTVLSTPEELQAYADPLVRCWPAHKVHLKEAADAEYDTGGERAPRPDTPGIKWSELVARF